MFDNIYLRLKSVKPTRHGALFRPDLDSDVRDQGVDALLDSDEFPSKRNRIAPRGHFAFHGTQQSTSIVTRSDGVSGDPLLFKRVCVIWNMTVVRFYDDTARSRI